MSFIAQENCLDYRAVYAPSRDAFEDRMNLAAGKKRGDAGFQYLPDFDPTFAWGIKRWRIVSNDPVTISVLVQPDLTQMPVLQQITMTAADAARVNFPGSSRPQMRYDDWRQSIVPVYGTYRTNFFGFPADKLIDQSQWFLFLTDAELAAIESSLKAAGAQVAVATPAEPFTVIGNDTRKAVDFIVNGTRYSAGQLFREMNVPYMGAAGTWTVHDGGGISWTPSPIAKPTPVATVVAPLPVQQPGGYVPVLMQFGEERILGFDTVTPMSTVTQEGNLAAKIDQIAADTKAILAILSQFGKV
jgi:hypothetical protein